MAKGKLIVFEGGDGAGKTTVAKGVTERLVRLGLDAVYTREPGGSKIAEAIRGIILDPQNTAMDARTEALLYAASRRQHLAETIIPALDAGKIVISDRYVYSSLVYQGYARGIGIAEVRRINDFAIEGRLPDRTIFLDLSAEEGLKRLAGRAVLDRLDKEALSFHQKVYAGYQLILREYRDNIEVFDASEAAETVIAKVTAYLEKIL